MWPLRAAFIAADRVLDCADESAPETLELPLDALPEDERIVPAPETLALEALVLEPLASKAPALFAVDFDIDGVFLSESCRRIEELSDRVGLTFCNGDGAADGSNSKRANGLADAEDVSAVFMRAEAEPSGAVGAPALDAVPSLLRRAVFVAFSGGEGSKSGAEGSSGATICGAATLGAEPSANEPLSAPLFVWLGAARLKAWAARARVAGVLLLNVLTAPSVAAGALSEGNVGADRVLDGAPEAEPDGTGATFCEERSLGKAPLFEILLVLARLFVAEGVLPFGAGATRFVAGGNWDGAACCTELEVSCEP